MKSQLCGVDTHIGSSSEAVHELAADQGEIEREFTHAQTATLEYLKPKALPKPPKFSSIEKWGLTFRAKSISPSPSVDSKEAPEAIEEDHSKNTSHGSQGLQHHQLPNDDRARKEDLEGSLEVQQLPQLDKGKQIQEEELMLKSPLACYFAVDNKRSYRTSDIPTNFREAIGIPDIPSGTKRGVIYPFLYRNRRTVNSNGKHAIDVLTESGHYFPWLLVKHQISIIGTYS